jgi:hypothetical protein
MANSPLNDLINKFGADVVEKAMQNLGAYRTIKGKKRRAVASDTLRKSLAYYYNAKKGKLEFFAKGKASVYADVVEQGRRARSKMPPVPAIVQWMKIKPIRLRNQEGKLIKQTPAKIEAAAFNIAKAIGRRGIPPLYYWRDAVNELIDVYEPQFAEALGKEIKIVIEDNLQQKIKV